MRDCQAKRYRDAGRSLRWLILLSCIVGAACSNGVGRAPPAHASGHVASSEAAARFDWQAAKAFWERSMALPGIDTGPKSSAKRMVVYFDADCPVCARQWQVLRPYLGQVRIHWIPIAYLDATSKRRGAAILAAPDPAQALMHNERSYDALARHGGYPIPDQVPKWALQAVAENTHRALHNGDVGGTPTLGFELYPGRRYYRMVGLLDAQGMANAVAALGHTMDPWRRTAPGGADSRH